MAIHIGTSGWSYDHWAGIVYPHGASSLRRLDAYVARFATVEVNNTFYRWPKEEVFATWRDRTPAGFIISIKASRGLTQFRKLNDPVPWLERMDAGLRWLGDKMGVLVLQLPPHFPYNPDRLARFLEVAPSWPRLTIEFRHPTWHREETFALLEARSVAYCIRSGANLACVLRATAPFVYVRLHGPDPGHLYGGCYSDADLRWWADRLLEWAALGRDVFAYFHNDGHGTTSATLRPSGRSSRRRFPYHLLPGMSLGADYTLISDQGFREHKAAYRTQLSSRSGVVIQRPGCSTSASRAGPRQLPARPPLAPTIRVRRGWSRRAPRPRP